MPRSATKLKVVRELEGTAAPRMVSRVVRVPLEAPPDEVWRELRRLAYQCASFGNTLLSETYAKAKGLSAEFTTYTDFNEVLSAGIRDAVSRECVGLWRRLGRVILRGEQTLARFSADRALVVRGRSVKLVRDGDGIAAQLRLHPRAQGEVTDLRVWMPALKRDRYLRELLDKLAAEEWKIGKGTIMFRRPGRRVFLLVAYNKPEGEAVAGSEIATCEISADGLVLRNTGGHRIAFGDRLHHMLNMKANFSGIHNRLRRDLNKRGTRYEHRRALLKAGNFEAWAQGPLHELSRKMVEWCRAEHVGEFRWILDHDAPDLPWHRLEQMVKYKGAEFSLQVGKVERAKPKESEEAGK
jgi:hypothetical protein